MIVQVCAAVLLTPVTWIVLLAIPTVPQVELVKPGSVPLVEGADQPAGTATLTCLFVFVAAAV